MKVYICDRFFKYAFSRNKWALGFVSVTDRQEKLERIEGQTNTSLVLVFLWYLLTIRKI